MSKQKTRVEEKWSDEYGLISKGNDDRLKNYQIQEELYERLEKKYAALIERVYREKEDLEDAFSDLTIDDQILTPNKKQHCLYAFRQLREAIRASERTDTFACKLYETSARVGIYMNHLESYVPSLQYLTDVIYPALSIPLTGNKLATCYLLYLVCVVGDFQGFLEMKKRWKINTQDASFRIAQFLIQNNYVGWRRLWCHMPWLYQKLMDQCDAQMQAQCASVLHAAYYQVKKDWVEPYVKPVLWKKLGWTVNANVVIIRERGQSHRI